MSGIRWLETDVLANQNISSPLAIGAYTAAADRAVMCQAFVDQAAGGGDYVMYCTLQIGGAGSSYVILPKTTMAAAAGETAIAGQSGWINVRSGDIVTVYVDGLAGDTTTPDTIVRWFEDAALQPTTADRTLAVDASGQVSVGAVATDAITATAIAADAIGSSELAATAVNEIADQVWDELLAGHVIAGSSGATLTTAGAGGGAIPASLWSYASRTLTQAAASVAATVAGSSITIQRGDTLSASLTNIGSLSGYVSLDFVVKQDTGQADTEALIWIRKNASGLSDGLLYLNGAAAATATNGSITIDDEPTGDVIIALAAAETDDLEEGTYVYDIQMISASGVLTKTSGTCIVSADVARAVV